MAEYINKPESNIPSIDLSITDRQRFSINNDPNRVVWLNTSDIGIAKRFKDCNTRLFEELDRVQNALAQETKDDEEALDVLIDTLESADKEMRKIVDELFDADVSSQCAPDGTMYDLFNGQFRFQIIIESLTKLYTTNLDNEITALQKKADKYTKKYHK